MGGAHFVTFGRGNNDHDFVQSKAKPQIKSETTNKAQKRPTNKTKTHMINRPINLKPQMKNQAKTVKTPIRMKDPQINRPQDIKPPPTNRINQPQSNTQI
eukprot:311050_1